MKKTEQLASWFVSEIEELEKNVNSEEEYFEKAQNIYNVAINSLCDFISETCSERGILLKRIWSEHDKMVKNKLGKAYNFAKKKDNQLTNFSAKILEKYENKVKENDRKVAEIKKLNEYYESQLDLLRQKIEKINEENAFLKIQQKGLLDENSRLQREVNEVKEINKAMRLFFSNEKCSTRIFFILREKYRNSRRFR